MLKGQRFSGFYPLKPGLRDEPVAEPTASQDRHLHLTTFKNSIFVQKRI